MMRLTHLEGKDAPPVLNKKGDTGKTEEIALLRELQKEMHNTMLQADLVLRRIAQILDNY